MFRVVSSLFVVGFALLALLTPAGPGALAEEGAEDQAPAVWVFDVRAVRVDLEDAATAEQPAPWEKAGPSVAVTLPWKDLLAGLKTRGTTTLLLDQRVTTVTGMQCKAEQRRNRQIQQFQRRDMRNETWQSSTLDQGVSAALTADPSGLAYDVSVRWVLGSGIEGWRPETGTASWSGRYPHPGGGQTLVLAYREQIDREGQERRGVELYAFLTARKIPSR